MSLGYHFVEVGRTCPLPPSRSTMQYHHSGWISVLCAWSRFSSQTQKPFSNGPQFIFLLLDGLEFCMPAESRITWIQAGSKRSGDESRQPRQYLCRRVTRRVSGFALCQEWIQSRLLRFPPITGRKISGNKVKTCMFLNFCMLGRLKATSSLSPKTIGAGWSSFCRSYQRVNTACCNGM